ncbi:MAG: hypothetical protein JWL64_2572 [Frankiales bacterium]|nr:hypothetical protein [Frankiales bacterium]
MNTPSTLVLFAAGLAVVFAAAAGVGHAVGPVGTTEASAHGAAHGGDSPDAAVALPQGLSSTAAGRTLALESTTLPQGRDAELAFRVLGPDGRAETTFTPTHDRDLHLIVVRRDGSGFQHVHPVRDPAGRWTVPLTLPAAGSYKVFADTAAGRDATAITLAADLSVAGDFQPQRLPVASRTAQVDGYTVTLSGDLVAGTAARLVLSVSRAGAPVTDLEPYLAAYGHLVSLRVGDLAYLHTHPEGEPGDSRTPSGPDVTFSVDVPTAGDYLLYLDFQHAGVVRTAEFTATAAAAPAHGGQPEGS